MRRAIILALLLMLVGSGSTRADQSDELRQKAAVIKAEAVRLVDAGQRSEASRLATIADDLMALADRFGPGPLRGYPSGPTRVLVSLNSHLQDRQKRLAEVSRMVRNPNDPVLRRLRNDIGEIKRDITQVERETRNAGKIEEAASRILHLRAAADHLQQAGMLDLAGQTLIKAAVLDQELLETQKKLSGKDQPPPAPADSQKTAEADELRKEMEKMRAELEELRKQVKAK